MPKPHSAAAHAVFSYLLIDADFTGATIERVEQLLGVLEPEQLTHVAAVADQLSAIALAVSAHRQTADGVPPEIVQAAQREHERAVPQVYRQTYPAPIWSAEPVTLGQATPPQVVSFDEDPFWVDGDGEG